MADTTTDNMPSKPVELVLFTKEDFETTEKPYEYLWNLRNNPLRQQQELDRFSRLAKTYGITNFKTLWKSYLQTVHANQKMVENENCVEWDMGDLMDSDVEKFHSGQYICVDDGVYYVHPAFGQITVCPHPIMPIERIVNIDSGECKIKLAFRRDRRHWQEIIIDKTILSSSQQIVRLAAYGISVNSENARELVRFLSTIEDLNYQSMTERKSIGRLGWVDSYGVAPYVEELQFDGIEDYRQAFTSVHSSGSEKVWMDFVKKMRAGNNIPARIMLAASFASILVEPMKALPFIVHAWSNTSGVGKSVGMMVAASVWAYPEIGSYVKTFNSTTVGLEMIASFCGSLPVCMDELCLQDGRKESFDAMIYQYCEGVGRTRGSKNGGLQRTRTWKNCCIATGEYPITSDTSKSGAVNRVIEINCGDMPMFDDARATVKLVCSNYGYAGPRFVKTLDSDALAEIQSIQDRFFSELVDHSTDKQRLSASLILAADEWATKTLFRDDRALTVDEIAPFLQSKDSVDVNRRAYEYLVDTITSNPMRFTPKEDGTYQGECWGSATRQYAYIIRSVFNRLMEDARFNTSGFLNWARAHGLLELNASAPERYTTLKRIKGIKTPARCIALKISEVEEASKEPVAEDVTGQVEIPF